MIRAALIMFIGAIPTVSIAQVTTCKRLWNGDIRCETENPGINIDWGLANRNPGAVDDASEGLRMRHAIEQQRLIIEQRRLIERQRRALENQSQGNTFDDYGRRVQETPLNDTPEDE